MCLTRAILLVLPFVLASQVAAETMRFEESAAILGTSCAVDIDANCRGVNLDPTRLKDCLTRNQDAISAQCKADYGRAFDAIQKRVAARSAASKLCERDVAKFCPGVQKGETSKALSCLLAGPRGVSINCNKAITEAGYR